MFDNQPLGHVIRSNYIDYNLILLIFKGNTLINFDSPMSPLWRQPPSCVGTSLMDAPLLSCLQLIKLSLTSDKGDRNFILCMLYKKHTEKRLIHELLPDEICRCDTCYLDYVSHCYLSYLLGLQYQMNNLQLTKNSQFWLMNK